MRTLPLIALLTFLTLPVACGDGGNDASPLYSNHPPGWPNQHGREGVPGGDGSPEELGASPVTSICEGYYGKLRACGFMSAGITSCEEPQYVEPWLVCVMGCFMSANCVALEDYYCAQSEADLVGSSVWSCLVGCEESEPHFTCNDGEEIPAGWRCDGEEDCWEGEDEANCTRMNAFLCAGEEGEYVPLDYVCDGYDDCDDGSDEEGCPAGTHFTCDDGEHIPTSWRCDGYDDCYDDSDEEGCPAGTMFACGDGDSVPNSFQCDGDEDCENGADEIGCATWTLWCMQDDEFWGGGGHIESDTYSPDDTYDSMADE